MATQLGAQADGWQTIDAEFLTPLPSQGMATPRRAALSSTAPTQRRGRSTMARTWPCLRWAAWGPGTPPTIHLHLHQLFPPSFPAPKPGVERGCAPLLASCFYPISLSGILGPWLSRDSVNLHHARMWQLLFHRWGNRGPDWFSDLPKATQHTAGLAAGAPMASAPVRLATGGAAWAWGHRP